MANTKKKSQKRTPVTGETASNEIHKKQPPPRKAPKITPVPEVDPVEEAKEIAANVQDQLAGMVTPPGVPGSVLTGRYKPGKKKTGKK